MWVPLKKQLRFETETISTSGEFVKLLQINILQRFSNIIPTILRLPKGYRKPQIPSFKGLKRHTKSLFRCFFLLFGTYQLSK